jgi:hypothetical protein
MRILRTIVLAGTVVAMPPVHAADKSARPSEVHGVKLSSICVDCGVVSDIRKETVTRKGSGKSAADATPASGAANESDKKAKTATVWTTTIVFKGGTTQTYQQGRNPGLHAGDVVIVEEGVPRKYVQ